MQCCRMLSDLGPLKLTSQGDYQVTVDGDCMEPALYAGDVLLVSTTAPLLPGLFIALAATGTDGRRYWYTKLLLRPVPCFLDGTLEPLVSTTMLKPRPTNDISF